MTQFFAIYQNQGCDNRIIAYISTKKTLSSSQKNTCYNSVKIPNPKKIVEEQGRLCVGILLDPTYKSDLESYIGANRLLTVPVGPNCGSGQELFTDITTFCGPKNPNTLWITDSKEGKATCEKFNTSSKVVAIVLAPLERDVLSDVFFTNFLYENSHRGKRGIDGRPLRTKSKNEMLCEKNNVCVIL